MAKKNKKTPCGACGQPLPDPDPDDWSPPDTCAACEAEIEALYDGPMDAVYAGQDEIGWPFDLPRPCFVAWAVDATLGVVSNGGFQYFFENDWPQSPNYSLFVQAFREIGASEEADLLAEAVADFPMPEPHLDLEARRKHLQASRSTPDEDDSKIDRLGDKVMARLDAVRWKLAQYVRSHPSEFSAS